MLRIGIIGQLLLTLSFLVITDASCAQSKLIPLNSTWKYFVTPTEPAGAWESVGFDDSSWNSGAAPLGYGDTMATTIGYGPSSSNKYITTYFRHKFNVSDAANVASLLLRLQRDDGAVVYLNGNEVFRTNMPAVPVYWSTLATTAMGGSSETQFHSTQVSAELLQNGDNVIAVELHQSGANSSDLRLNLELTASPSVIRGPYLQMGTSSSMVIRWRTDIPTDSRVAVGNSTQSLTMIKSDADLVTDHSMMVANLAADSRYYYSVGTTTMTLAGGDDGTYFHTSQVEGDRSPKRIWVIGDAGRANANQKAVRDAYYNLTGEDRTHLWLQLGDNAYNSGKDDEYQAAVFDMYNDLLKRSVTWPTIGNHDSVTSSVYYNIFTLPTAGEAGGIPSETEQYYSFDYGNIHFVCLDSQDADRSDVGPMMTWLKEDLTATTQDWIIAFWHHPPYSKGSHNSNTEGRLVDMRQVFLPVFEEHGVDLVLTGHSHSYERSKFLNGHYDTTATYTTSMEVDGGSGRIDDTGAYKKEATKRGTDDGAVYIVAGSSGAISGGPLDHPAMYVSMNTLGSLILEVDSNQLDARFLTSVGFAADYFTIVRDKNTSPAVVSITCVDSNPTAALSGNVSFNVVFNHVVKGVDATDFALETTGAVTPTISSVSGSGSRYRVTVNVGTTGNGTVQLRLIDNDSIRNGVQTLLGGTGASNGNFTTGETYTIDRGLPLNGSVVSIE